MTPKLFKFLILGTLLVGMAILIGGATAPKDSPPPKIIEPLPDMVLGDPQAPITIIEYSSFTCDHCAEFHEKTLPLLKQNYINKGKVRLIFREYPSDGLSLRATSIARCVPPNLYFKVVETLFHHQQKWIFAKEYGRELWKILRPFGFKREQINDFMAKETMFDRIVQSRIHYQKEHKISNTPTFIIHGQIYPHFLSFETLDKILKALNP